MLKLVKSDINNFNEIYEDMLLQFPKSELQDFCVYENLLKKGDYLLFLAKDDGKNIGYFLLFEDKPNNSLWLDYIAVFKSFHSKGYGKTIFSLLKDSLSTYNGVYLEVEKPDQEKPDTIRRISFYENLGAKKLDCEYYYPNKDGCIPLDLYFLAFGENGLPKCDQVKDTIRMVFDSLHCHLEHVNEVFDKIVT